MCVGVLYEERERGNREGEKKQGEGERETGGREGEREKE
jgi:hypothetical protein